MIVYMDAHFHADDLYQFESDFPQVYQSFGVLGLASVHDMEGYKTTRSLLAESGPYLVSFGLHPQLAVMEQAENLAKLAESGQIAAVGECGFDFFGDAPDLVRTPENERTQRMVFEFQLELAQRHTLPVVLHMRRANDLLFEYSQRLSNLRAVILHSWGGPANEALDFLSRCPQALFSFGNSIVNGNKKAASSAAALPLSAILTETDAPYQPPRAELPLQVNPTSDPSVRVNHRRPLVREYSNYNDLPRIVETLAHVRAQTSEVIAASVEENFRKAFSHAL